MKFFKKILDIFRRAPEAGIYARIAQEAYKVSARYRPEFDGGLSITRGDGAVMRITPLQGGKFLIQGGTITKKEGRKFGEDMMWIYLHYFLSKTKAAP